MKKFSISPIVKILLTFIVIIIIGMFLLMLPISQTEIGLSWIDAFFTSCSAVCVTGLSSVPNIGVSLTTFGKTVLGFLMQIGGLGLVTITSFILMILGGKIGINDRYLIKESLNQINPKGMMRLVKDVIIMTISIEILGMTLNLFVFIPIYGVAEGIGISIFHAVSAFNNCGFDIFGYGSSMEPSVFTNNVLLNISTSILIVFGGLGFIVIRDLIKNKFRWKKLNIHTKIVLKVTVTLIILGTIFIYFSEYNHSDISFMQAIFQSISSRTAGFSSISMLSINSLTLLVISVLMFMGASPSSTGGGIKTTTLYVMIKSMYSYVRNKPAIVNTKKIGNEAKVKAFSIIILMMVFIVFASMAIVLIESNTASKISDIGSVIFESISAISNTGFSLGISIQIHVVSKLILCFLMISGRLGVIALVEIGRKKTIGNVDYVEEKIIVG